MPILHDPDTRQAIQARLKALRPDAQRQWGVMRVDQMLHHVNCTLENALGRLDAPTDKLPLPPPVMRFIVLNLPWPKSAPTNASYLSPGDYDFEAERAKALALTEEFARKRVDADWGLHPAFGRMTGKQHSKLQAKHLDHHLRQFGG